MIEAGKVLQNRYRVEKQIGAGGMGAVYIATDERFGSVVAIKETFFTDDKFRKAFEREARLLNSLKHHALPRVSDHFIEGNGQFLVMEYIDGDDLSEQIEQEGKVFSVKEVLNWADQLLDALEFLHTQEMPVIHRDIKPQNLKLTSRGQIILLDFGLAKGNITNAESATAAKSVFGYSRNYASIEQIQGSGTDPRSDLYALSATLYHLLTGVPPVDALTRAMNVLSEKEDPLFEANKIRADIPVGVSRVLHEAMALNANQRPSSAKEMRVMLAEVKDEVPLENTQTVADNLPDTNIFTRKTQLHSETSQSSKPQQSEIKTETFSNEFSKITELKPQTMTGDFEESATKIHPLTATANGKKSRRGLAIGAALGSLILAASAASALYVYKPEVFGISNDAVNTNTGKQLIIVQIPPENVNLAEANANAENSNAVAGSANANVSTETKQKEVIAKPETKQIETKQTDPTKNQSKPKTDINIVKPDDNKDTVDADEPPDNDPPPTKTKNGQQIPPFVWKKMSPQERRQLRQALEIQRQQQQLEQQQRRNQPRRNQPIPPPPNN
ncbi:MAG: serine/threonine-protein kinase [Actinomycetota bacterium]